GGIVRSNCDVLVPQTGAGGVDCRDILVRRLASEVLALEGDIEVDRSSQVAGCDIRGAPAHLSLRCWSGRDEGVVAFSDPDGVTRERRTYEGDCSSCQSRLEGVSNHGPHESACSELSEGWEGEILSGEHADPVLTGEEHRLLPKASRHRVDVADGAEEEDADCRLA